MKSLLLRHIGRWLLGFLCQTALVVQLQAQPYVVSSVPANGAAGVSPSAPVVFTFNEPMNPAFTSAAFLDTSNPLNLIQTTPSWDGTFKVLTCTPVPPAFPSPNKLIYWAVTGESAQGEPTSDTDFGLFTTGTGGGGSGSGTNKLTGFVTGIAHYYNQASTGVATLDPNTPYNFMGNVVLASNRTATSITLTLPTASVRNLTQNMFAPEMFYVMDTQTDLATFNSTYPQGSYQFFVQAPASNQTVSVTMPATSAQPPAPHISNFSAAQSVDATQPFQLTWDTWAGGTASDYVSVDISEAGFRSPDYKMPGALTGTATAFNIPANTLQANSNYAATIGFYRPTYTSNATYTTLAYRATITTFTIATSGGAGTPPVVSNPGWAAGRFAFDVASAAGQPVTVLYSSNLMAGQWYTLVTTNSPGGLVRIVDPRSTTNKVMFYRARNGS